MWIHPKHPTSTLCFQEQLRPHYCFPSQGDSSNNHQRDQGHPKYVLRSVYIRFRKSVKVSQVHCTIYRIIEHQKLISRHQFTEFGSTAIETNLRNVSTRLNWLLLERRTLPRSCCLNLNRWLVLECKNSSPVHAKDFSQLLLVCLFCWRAESWILLALLAPFCQHVMCIIEIYGRPVWDEPIQLPLNKSRRVSNWKPSSKL